jgi:tetrahydromethanopterin S-methyltransferase subunit G
MTAMRQHLSGVVTLQEHDHGDIAAIKHRLDRIERRLELAE